MLTINVAVLLAVIVVLRLRRRTQARSRLDEKFTVVIVLAFGVLIAPTDFGQGILSVLNQLVEGISHSGREATCCRLLRDSAAGPRVVLVSANPWPPGWMPC